MSAPGDSQTDPPIHSWLWFGHLVFWALMAGFAVTSLAILKPWPLATVLISAVLWVTPGALLTTAVAKMARRLQGPLAHAVAWGGVIAMWYGIVAAVHWAATGQPHRPQTVWTTASFIGVVTVTWGAFFVFARQIRKTQAERRRLVAARLEANEATLRSLRYQLRPHFLFNALNSISTAIEEDPAAAQRALAGLSELLRDTLDAGDHGTVEDEVRRLRLYLELESARFEDELDVTIDVDADALASSMPPLLLQPLVENAVRHGKEADQRLLLRIVVRLNQNDELSIRVSNSGELSDGADSAGERGLGLENVRRRLEAVAPGAYQLELRAADGWVHAELEMPGGRRR
ncbi:MAG: histidine kinase [Myxococcota bacterium]